MSSNAAASLFRQGALCGGTFGGETGAWGERCSLLPSSFFRLSSLLFLVRPGLSTLNKYG